MSWWAKILIGVGVRVGGAIGDRIAEAIISVVTKGPASPTPTPADIATATRSAESANREGRIASRRARERRP